MTTLTLLRRLLAVASLLAVMALTAPGIAIAQQALTATITVDTSSKRLPLRLTVDVPPIRRPLFIRIQSYRSPKEIISSVEAADTSFDIRSVAENTFEVSVVNTAATSPLDTTKAFPEGSYGVARFLVDSASRDKSFRVEFLNGKREVIASQNIGVAIPRSVTLSDACRMDYVPLNTGIDPGTGLELPWDNLDPNWMLVSAPTPTPASIPAWVHNPGGCSDNIYGANWLSPWPWIDGANDGVYVYERAFCVSEAATAQVKMYLRAVDVATVQFVDGNGVTSTIGAGGAGCEPWTLISTTVQLKPGKNSIRIGVANVGGFSPTSLYVIGDVRSQGTLHIASVQCCRTGSRGLCSEFNDRVTGGWTGQRLNLSVQMPGPSGLPDDFYLLNGDASGISRLHAPKEFLGDLRSTMPNCSRELCFDIRIFNDARGNVIDYPIATLFLISGTDTARYTSTVLMSGPNGANSGWQHVCAPLDPTLPPGWTMVNRPAAAWNQLITNVTDVVFGFDPDDEQTELWGLDNVCIKNNCDPCSPRCDSMSIEPFPIENLGLSGRMFTIHNEKMPESPICSVKISVTPAPPSLVGGGLYIDGSGVQSSWTNAGSNAFTKIDHLNGLPAFESISFHLGIDNGTSPPWSGSVTVTSYHCDGDSCTTVYDPWTATKGRAMNLGTPVVVTEKERLRVYRLAFPRDKAAGRNIRSIEVRHNAPVDTIVAVTAASFFCDSSAGCDDLFGSVRVKGRLIFADLRRPLDSASTEPELTVLYTATDDRKPIVDIIYYDGAGNEIGHDTATVLSNTLSSTPNPDDPHTGTSHLFNSLGAWPNPTSGKCDVTFKLPSASTVTLTLRDELGRHVGSVIAGERLQAGEQRRSLDLSGLPSGSYFVELKVNEMLSVIRVEVVR